PKAANTCSRCAGPRVSTVSITSTSSSASLGAVREWTTSSTLAPLSLTTPSSLLSPPGRSGMVTFTARYRPAARRPWVITWVNTSGSILPPDKTAHTGPCRPSSGADVISAATAAAPAGSTMSFARSMHSNSARDSASSLTVRTESANARTWANGIAPGNATAIPSAIVDIDSARTGCPAANEPGHAAAFAACTPITRTCGARKGGRPSNSGDQPAAAGRHHDGCDIPNLRQDLQPDGGLAGNDVGMIER